METTTKTDDVNSWQDWESTNASAEYFSADDIIDAYQKGHSEAIGKFKDLIKDKIKTNIKETSNNVISLLEDLKDYEFYPDNVLLKIDNWDQFYILFIISEEEFLSPNILDIYQMISDYEDKVKNELYNLTISICSKGEGFNLKKIASDGYILQHSLNKNGE
tara:strand:- start:447 stop:932 length:486 start_codon:yes stop_codon:yes gene_type:complete